MRRAQRACGYPIPLRTFAAPEDRHAPSSQQTLPTEAKALNHPFLPFFATSRVFPLPKWLFLTIDKIWSEREEIWSIMDWHWSGSEKSFSVVDWLWSAADESASAASFSSAGQRPSPMAMAESAAAGG